MNNYKKINQDPPSCIHNAGVNCSPGSRNCATCGWNPNVAKERLEKLGYRSPEQKNSKKN